MRPSLLKKSLGLILLFGFTLAGCRIWDHHYGAVKQGFLDLSDWDMKQPVQLQGEWMFFDNELLGLEEVRSRMREGRVSYALTGKPLTEINGGRGNKAKATYAMTLRLNYAGINLVIANFLIQPRAKISSSCSQGEKVGPMNRAYQPREGKGLQNQWYLSLPAVELGSQDCLIIAEVDSPVATWSGMWSAGNIDRERYDRQAGEAASIALGLLMGLILYVSLIHFSYWMRARHEFYHLYIVVCGIGGLVRVLLWTPANGLLAEYYNIEVINGFQWLKLALAGTLLINLGYLGFLRSVFYLAGKSRVLKVFQMIFAVMLLIAMGANPELIGHISAPFYLLGNVSGFVCLAFGIAALLKHEADAGKIVLGTAVWIVTGLAAFYINYNVPIMKPIQDLFGFGFFLLCLSQIVASRYAATSRDNIRLLREVQENERARTLFFQNSSHELRTPLNGIIGYLDLLQHERTERFNEKTHDYLRKLLRLAESLKSQVNTVLDLAKSKRGELQLLNSSLSISAFKDDCDSLAEGLLVRYPGSHYQSKLDLQGHSEQFINDRDKLFAIARNLIGNAFKFTRPSAENRVKLQLSLSPEGLTITVQDQGIGIPSDQRDKIFEEFVQVNGDARRSYEGTGLGLAMVRDFVRLMGGKIELDSSEGVGSTFTIKIPEQKQITLDLSAQKHLVEIPSSQLPAGVAKALAIPRQKSSSTQRQYTILVVDDHAINCEILAEILSAEGHLVETAEGGNQALAKIRKQAPDLILLDMMMPEVSGEDVLRAVRGDETLKTIPIILITARASEEDRIFGLTLGADDYLAKPIIADEVRLRVHNLLLRLEQHQQVQELEERDRMAQLGELLGDISHEVKNIYQGLDVYDALDPARTHRLLKLLAIPDSEQKILQTIVTDPNRQSSTGGRVELMAIDKAKSTSQQLCLRMLRSELIFGPVDDSALLQFWNYALSLDQEQLLSMENLLGLMDSYREIRISSQRGYEVVNAILNYGRPEQDGRCRLPEALASVNQLCRVRMKRVGCEFSAEVIDTQLAISSSALQQILLNLILNAVDAVGELDKKQRWVRLESQLTADHFILRMSNGGPKIDSALIPKLFDRGFTTKGQKGSGIGLYVSRRLAQKASSVLSVDTAAPETCFVIEIPLSKTLQKTA